jgi:Uma2 family endonuclease
MGALDPSSLLLRRHRITADEYHRLGDAGVLAADARVELIDGEVIDMAPIGSRHWSVVNRLHRLLERAVGDRAVVSSQSSLRLGSHSEPQPDLALFKPRDDFYAGALPTADDALLLVEVSDSTARYDIEVKLPLYARHRVPELWIVDLDAGLLRSYRRPDGDHYAEVGETASPGISAIAALPGISIDLTRLLG